MSTPRHTVATGIPQQRSDSAVVEQAKGALMLLYGVEAARAHELLQEWSVQSGYQQVLIAEALLYGVSPGAERVPPDDLVLWLTQQLRYEGPGLPAGY